MQTNILFNEDSIQNIWKIPNQTIHLILSDIPYGIGIDEWDVKHNNTNSAYLGSSPAQKKCGKIFAKRGKPLNGWSEADKQIPKQYYDWCLSWTLSWYRVLIPGGNVFIFAGRRLAHRCIAAMEDAGFIFKDMIAWDKVVAPYRAQHLSLIYERRKDTASALSWQGWRVGNLRPTFEPILWFVKPYKIGGTLADNVLQYETGAFNETILKKYHQGSNNILHIQASSKDSGLHPTQKPLNLMKILIEMTTKNGQIILDPFCGSGTTLVAAMQLHRKYIGFENNQAFFETAQKRIREEEINMQTLLFD